MSVVSVRVDEKVRKKLEGAGVDVASEVRKHLEELAWRVELGERMDRLERSMKKAPTVPRGFAARSVREDRDGR